MVSWHHHVLLEKGGSVQGQESGTASARSQRADQGRQAFGHSELWWKGQIGGGTSTADWDISGQERRRGNGERDEETSLEDQEGRRKVARQAATLKKKLLQLGPPQTHHMKKSKWMTKSKTKLHTHSNSASAYMCQTATSSSSIRCLDKIRSRQAFLWAQTVNLTCRCWMHGLLWCSANGSAINLWGVPTVNTQVCQKWILTRAWPGWKKKWSPRSSSMYYCWKAAARYTMLA